jgi:hypothetical protein
MFGSMAKSFHPGRSAQNGYASALLAQAGFTAGERGIEGPRGFAAVTAARYDLSRITTRLNRNGDEGINYPEAVHELRAEDFARLGSDYLGYAQMHRRQGAPRFIDKMPNNFPSIGLLALILPNARIIDARRHPLDACLSCYRQLFAKGQAFTYDLTEIGEYYLQYQRMMDHWAQVLRGECSPCNTKRWSRTSRRRRAGCWTSVDCDGKRPACGSTRAIVRCARLARSRFANRSTIAQSATGSTTLRISTSSRR